MSKSTKNTEAAAALKTLWGEQVGILNARKERLPDFEKTIRYERMQARIAETEAKIDALELAIELVEELQLIKDTLTSECCACLDGQRDSEYEDTIQYHANRHKQASALLAKLP